MQGFYKEHFVADLPKEVARRLFKNSVNNVEMSISSYCNRRCHYCPNHFVDRISRKDFMSDEVFINILESLRSIDYDQLISIHRYNEPLASKAYALSRISSIRSFLPKANLRIYSNGDYLTKQYIQSLADLGVNLVVVTIHGRKEGDSFETLYEDLKSRVERLDMPYNLDSNSAIVRCGELKVGYQILPEEISGRGMTITTPKQHKRIEPCLSPFAEMQIEYDGTLLPCCELHPDVESHKSAIIGKIDGNSDIFEAWTSQNYVNWRRAMLSFEQKSAPCTNCKSAIMIENQPQYVARINAIREGYGL